MKVYGATPLTSTMDIGIVKCRHCDKSFLKSAIVEHAGEMGLFGSEWSVD